MASPLTRREACALALVQRAGRGILVLPGRAIAGGILVRMPVVVAFFDRGARGRCRANSQRGERKQRGHDFASSAHGFLSEALISTSADIAATTLRIGTQSYSCLSALFAKFPARDFPSTD